MVGSSLQHLLMYNATLCLLGQVVEELLSSSGALGKETAKGIADAAMLEVASISMGHMVGLGNHIRVT